MASLSDEPDRGKPSALLPVGTTVGELQSAPLSVWGNEDIIKGLAFCATMQLRTPLRVLLRHGALHTDRHKTPPQIALEPWEGIWLPVTKSMQEIIEGPDSTTEALRFGIAYDASFGALGNTMASDVGPILAKDYLPFLIAVRRVVEANDSRIVPWVAPPRNSDPLFQLLLSRQNLRRHRSPAPSHRVPRTFLLGCPSAETSRLCKG
jgi:hypothetical protein